MSMKNFKIDKAVKIHSDGEILSVEPYVHVFTTHTKARWIGRTVLDIFSFEFSSHTPEYFEKAIRTGTIRVNGQIVSPTYILKGGEKIEHFIHRHEPSVPAEPVYTLSRMHVEGESVVERDLFDTTANVIVMNKPAGMPVYPCGPHHHLSVFSLYCRNHDICSSTLFPVHRLDRLTSGLLIVARDKHSASLLSSQIRDAKVRKRYLFLARGTFPVVPSSSNSSLSISTERAETDTSNLLLDTTNSVASSTHSLPPVMLAYIPQANKDTLTDGTVAIRLPALGDIVESEMTVPKSECRFLSNFQPHTVQAHWLEEGGDDEDGRDRLRRGRREETNGTSTPIGGEDSGGTSGSWTRRDAQEMMEEKAAQNKLAALQAYQNKLMKQAKKEKQRQFEAKKAKKMEHLRGLLASSSRIQQAADKVEDASLTQSTTSFANDSEVDKTPAPQPTTQFVTQTSAAKVIPEVSATVVSGAKRAREDAASETKSPSDSASATDARNEVYWTQSGYLRVSASLERLDPVNSVMGVASAAANSPGAKDAEKVLEAARESGKTVPQEVPVARKDSVTLFRRLFYRPALLSECKLHPVQSANRLPEQSTELCGHEECGYSLVEAVPLSGRTHQIRVHSAYLGFPIHDDPVYCAEAAKELLRRAQEGANAKRSASELGKIQETIVFSQDDQTSGNSGNDNVNVSVNKNGEVCGTGLAPGGPVVSYTKKGKKVFHSPQPSLEQLQALCVSCNEGVQAEFSPVQNYAKRISLHSCEYTSTGHWSFRGSLSPWVVEYLQLAYRMIKEGKLEL